MSSGCAREQHHKERRTEMAAARITFTDKIEDGKPAVEVTVDFKPALEKMDAFTPSQVYAMHLIEKLAKLDGKEIDAENLMCKLEN
jgi:predicted RNA-binding protein